MTNCTVGSRGLCPGRSRHHGSGQKLQTGPPGAGAPSITTNAEKLNNAVQYYWDGLLTFISEGFVPFVFNQGITVSHKIIQRSNYLELVLAYFISTNQVNVQPLFLCNY